MKRTLVFMLAWMALICASESQEFIDDEGMAAEFEKKLSLIAERGRGWTMAEAKTAAQRKNGFRISLPDESPGQDAANSKNLYDRVAPAVVAIGTVYRCAECRKWHQDGFSSGWILSPEGLVVTNAHVFDGATSDVPGVLTRDGQVYALEEMVVMDPAADVAIFRIQAEDKKFPFLRIAEDASVGEEVHVVSHPQGRLWCFTSGRISRFHLQRYDEDKKPTEWMSVTADFAGGSSGGPVLNASGEVVGMVSSTLTAYSEASNCKNHPDPEVQMVFKDCVPLNVLRSMLEN
jgi:S1-C subfamily serine protease